jgi:hypothetical protein
MSFGVAGQTSAAQRLPSFPAWPQILAEGIRPVRLLHSGWRISHTASLASFVLVTVTLL